ncbi:MAG: glycosyltransferase family 2 protein, partial [Chitinispirillaceae bacterium]|nr:glycosyltransferase family 2 protein [Chitinispirillaceae bacterium]
MSLYLRTVENLLILYFCTFLLLDVLLFIYAVAVFRRRRRYELPESACVGHPVSIVVPGYNEAVTIVPCLRQLMNLDYKEYDVVFINDGSTDGTLEKVLAAFELHELPSEACLPGGQVIETAPVRGIYRSIDGRLVVIDKENGGKADSINAGINRSAARYICTVDADSILDRSALRAVLHPLINDPRTFVSGGQLAAANGLHLSANRVTSARMPHNLWVLWQIAEYIRSFMISKIGLSRFGVLLIMSGAFSVYRRDDLRAVDGFLTPRNFGPYLANTIGHGRHTVCEDMEIVVRLRRYYRESGRKGTTAFMPAPVCWT